MEARSGLTLIELLIVLAIISIFIVISIFAWKPQLMKGRDGRRKADLRKLQNILEDYLSDKNCYPDSLADVCPSSVVPDLSRPYLSQAVCDPLDNNYFNYYYSLDSGEICKSWYKIYTRLEIEDDSIIDEVGCSGGCGPSDNYNYWVSSPNVTSVAQLTGEDWPIILDCIIIDPAACDVACTSFSEVCGACCPGTERQCIMYNSTPQCCFTTDCPVP